ncbi:PREDICTED: uncharacterized protein LOC101819108 [Ficedula albicollis]|uniref:uncharacterized protein LOC101819108 n=1 Tax=Ficedula albicollis TaxID=59894 RepID=UPI000359BD7A|nr:PREDICTED: uncharacterized protein LOC101819108 [Ficedula albicollis]
MAAFTLGQILEIALGSSKAGAVDFEQLYNLLNGMLLHLGLRDLAVQENGEPLEGSERSPFSAAFLEELMRRVEANEKDITEVRTLCQDLREEVIEMKVEQSRMMEDMQRMQEEFATNVDELRNQLLSTMTEMLQGKKGSRDVDTLSVQSRPLDDDLIVIGNEITLVDRSVSRLGDMRPASPMPQRGKTPSRGKGLLEPNASSQPVSEAHDMGQNVGRSDMGRRGMGWDTGQRDMGRRGMGLDTGQRDMGQSDMGQNGGQQKVRRKVQLSDTGQDDVGQIKDGEIKMSTSKAETLPSDLDVPPEIADVGEIMDEERKISISKAETLPSDLDVPPEIIDAGEIMDTDIMDEKIQTSMSKVEAFPSLLDGSPEMTSMGEIKDGETKMSFFKAPPDVQKKGLDSGFTASGMHPGAPGTHPPVQQVQPIGVPPGSQKLWTPDKSVAGTSRHPPTRPSAPPQSPSFSGHLPRAFKRHPCVPVPRRRELAPPGYSRRSPLYSGGKHTTTYAVQPMEPLLPDPNKPGVCELMGKDGLLYRGRTP